MPLYRLVPLLLLLSGCSLIQPYDRESAAADTESAASAETSTPEEGAVEEAPAEAAQAPETAEQAEASAEAEPTPETAEEAEAPAAEQPADESAVTETAEPETAEDAQAAETTAPAAPATAPEPPVVAAPPAESTTPAEKPTGPLAVEPAERPRAHVQMPVRGMNMKDVEAQFGTPASKLSPVGKPPITRWIYRDYTVYFEYTEVLEAVPNTP